MSSRKCKTCDVALVSKTGTVRFVYNGVSLEMSGPLHVCPECSARYIDFLVIFHPDADRPVTDPRMDQEVRGNA